MLTSAELKTGRESMGLSTRWVALELNIAENTYQRWESANERYQINAGATRDFETIIDRFQAGVEEIIYQHKKNSKTMTKALNLDELPLFVPVSDTETVEPPYWPATAKRAMARIAARRLNLRITYAP